MATDPQSMKRIQCSTVTETLANAMEHAEDMSNVLVLAWHKEDCETEKGTGCVFSDSNMTVADLALMMLQFQNWLANYSITGPDNEDEEDD